METTDTIEAITAWSTLGLLFATLLLVVITWRSVRVLGNQFKSQISPALSVYACRDNLVVWIVVKNVGVATCHQVRLASQSKLLDKDGDKLDIGMLRDGVPSLGPGQEIKIRWAINPKSYRNPPEIDSSPVTLVASGSSVMGGGRDVVANAQIDLAVFSAHHGLESDDRKVDELTEQVRRVGHSLKDMNRITKAVIPNGRFT